MVQKPRPARQRSDCAGRVAAYRRSPDSMWIFYAGLVGVFVSGVYLVWKVRAEYASRRKLTQATAIMGWIWYGLHAALTAYASWRPIWPIALSRTLAAVAGTLLSVTGVVIAAAGILELRSLQRMSGRATDELIASGIYGWSRNPQNVGWFLMLLGLAAGGRSAGAILLVALFAFTLHLYIVSVEDRTWNSSSATRTVSIAREHRVIWACHENRA